VSTVRVADKIRFRSSSVDIKHYCYTMPVGFHLIPVNYANMVSIQLVTIGGSSGVLPLDQKENHICHRFCPIITLCGIIGHLIEGNSNISSVDTELQRPRSHRWVLHR